MNEYVTRMRTAISSAILVPELYGIMFNMFIPSTYPIQWWLVLLIPPALLGLHWLLIFLLEKKLGYESIEKVPCLLAFWLIPAASMLSTMLLILVGRGMAPNPQIMVPMLVGFLLMLTGSFLPGKSLRQPLRFMGNVWIWCGGAIVFVSGLVHYYLYPIVIAVLVILPAIYSLVYCLIQQVSKRREQP